MMEPFTLGPRQGPHSAQLRLGAGWHCIYNCNVDQTSTWIWHHYHSKHVICLLYFHTTELGRSSQKKTYKKMWANLSPIPKPSQTWLTKTCPVLTNCSTVFHAQPENSYSILQPETEWGPECLNWINTWRISARKTSHNHNKDLSRLH